MSLSDDPESENYTKSARIAELEAELESLKYDYKIVSRDYDKLLEENDAMKVAIKGVYDAIGNLPSSVHS